jgi:hypothetical protein
MSTGDVTTGWRVTAASVIGAGHVRGNLPNQDRWRAEAVGPGTQLLAVADGAGSRSRAEHGAEFAVTAAHRAAIEVFGAGPPATLAAWRAASVRFASGCLREFDLSVTDEMRRIADQGNDEDELWRSFGTTLLAVVTAPPYLCFVSVGDCFLVVDRDPGGPHLLVAPQEREHAGGTVFLTSRGRDRHLSHGVVVDDRIRGLAVCSDGVSEGMLDMRTAPDGRLQHRAPAEFGSYFAHFGDPRTTSEELGAKLESPAFAATSNDDKTIVMAVRRP